MSPDDICTTCNHPRHRHQDDAGMCTESSTLIILTADDGTTTGVTDKRQPCHCNLFRGAPPSPPIERKFAAFALPAWTPPPVEPDDLSCADCPIGGRDGTGPVCPNVAKCDIECEQFCEDMAAGETATSRHVPPEFIVAMDRIFEAGVKGDRVAGDWKDLSRLVAANKTANLYIHMDAKEYAEVACNALILWWHFQRTKPAVIIAPGNHKESDHENT